MKRSANEQMTPEPVDLSVWTQSDITRRIAANIDKFNTLRSFFSLNKHLFSLLTEDDTVWFNVYCNAFKIVKETASKVATQWKGACKQRLSTGIQPNMSSVTCLVKELGTLTTKSQIDKSMQEIKKSLVCFADTVRIESHFKAWASKVPELEPLFQATKFEKVLNNTKLADYYVFDYRKYTWCLYSPIYGLPLRFEFLVSSSGDREQAEPECQIHTLLHEDLMHLDFLQIQPKQKKKSRCPQIYPTPDLWTKY